MLLLSPSLPFLRRGEGAIACQGTQFLGSATASLRKKVSGETFSIGNNVTICAFIESLPAGPMLKVLTICPQMELVISAKLRELFISKLVILQGKGQFGSQVQLSSEKFVENIQFGRVSGRCYGYCDRLRIWWIMLSALKLQSHHSTI